MAAIAAVLRCSTLLDPINSKVRRRGSMICINKVERSVAVGVVVGSRRRRLAVATAAQERNTLHQKETHDHDDQHVIYLSNKIRLGLVLEERKKRLQEILGYTPSNTQWAAYTNLSQKELNARLIQSSTAINKLVMANTGLVVSVATRYRNMGIHITELTQAGLKGLVRGLKKFDSTKGVKLSTYVHWWIRQAIVTFLIKHSRIIRLPAELHHLLSSIKNMKKIHKNEDVTSSIEMIALNLNVSKEKVKNAIRTQTNVISLERKRYANINCDPSAIVQDYITDSNFNNQSWFIERKTILKGDVNNLIESTLSNREKDIIRLYFGLDANGYTWEAIGKRVGLSRERVRQVGIVAIRKLKHSAIYHKLDEDPWSIGF